MSAKLKINDLTQEKPTTIFSSSLRVPVYPMRSDGVDAEEGEKFWEVCELQRLDLSFNQIAHLPAEVRCSFRQQSVCRRNF